MNNTTDTTPCTTVDPIGAETVRITLRISRKMLDSLRNEGNAMMSQNDTIVQAVAGYLESRDRAGMAVEGGRGERAMSEAGSSSKLDRILEVVLALSSKQVVGGVAEEGGAGMTREALAQVVQEEIAKWRAEVAPEKASYMVGGFDISLLDEMVREVYRDHAKKKEFPAYWNLALEKAGWPAKWVEQEKRALALQKQAEEALTLAQSLVNSVRYAEEKYTTLTQQVRAADCVSMETYKERELENLRRIAELEKAVAALQAVPEKRRKKTEEVHAAQEDAPPPLITGEKEQTEDGLY